MEAEKIHPTHVMLPRHAASARRERRNATQCAPQALRNDVHPPLLRLVGLDVNPVARPLRVRRRENVRVRGVAAMRACCGGS